MILRRVTRIFKLFPVENEIENLGKSLSNRNLHRCLQNNLSLPQNLASVHGKKNPKYGSYSIKKQYSVVAEEDTVDSNTFERVCEETLSSLADYFEDLVANEAKLENADVLYGVGVLTIDLGRYGTYVINRQSPNKQIWLSSPSSGPKRFDYVAKEDKWIYKHNGQELHSLLGKEFESIVGKKLELSKCAHSS